ncbi:hypothetical protein [Candidatus Odyssella acanthamoebae]|uniref:Uncharacterized protein n=1 Tax=Candidatus Odyssella acanthamoebae TaxID=91604 RepID=A0A077AUR1_9PROT|nr:hypothetical protein [Candidatus Paracaedibacter acanthamoebae]AIK96912.1 hypothetical protein ID47_09490 [Candidatus Paracaedibacter acanthamoebae]
MKKNFFSLLSASLFISSSVIAAEIPANFKPAEGVQYAISPKNLPNYFVTFATKKNDNGHYLQVAPLETPGVNERWSITAAPAAPGHFRIKKGMENTSGISFIIYNDEKSSKGQYMQMTPTQSLKDRGFWKITAAQKAPGYFKLAPKSLPGFFAVYSADEKTENGGFLLQIASSENPGNERFFSLVPQDYTLAATVTNFNFGDDIEAKLKAAALPDLSSVQTVQVKGVDLGVKIGGDYKKDITETFTWGLNEKLGISIQTTIQAGIPLVLEGKITLGGSFEFASNQSWTNTQMRSFTAKAEMSPKDPGTYRIGNIVYVATNVTLPFTATATYTALSKDEQLSAKAVKALCKYNGLTSKVISKDTNSISVAVSGKLKTTCGVYQETIAEKIA